MSRLTAESSARRLLETGARKHTYALDRKTKPATSTHLVDCQMSETTACLQLLLRKFRRAILMGSASIRCEEKAVQKTAQRAKDITAMTVAGERAHPHSDTAIAAATTNGQPALIALDRSSGTHSACLWQLFRE